MTYAICLNVAIILAIIFTVIFTHNPMALFALLMLKDLPYGLLLPAATPAEEKPSKPIGFH